MGNNTSKRAAIILGIFMAIVLVGGSLLQLFANNVAAPAQTIDPTDVPIPTFQPPPSDLGAIALDQVYLHPSGLYTIAQPSGFSANEPNQQPNLAQVNMVNQSTLAVIDAYVEDAALPAGETLTVDGLSDRFTPETLAASWSRFQRFTETARRTEGDFLIIDFEVTLNRQTYVARQKVRTDGDWIYVVRVLAPSNATEYLRFLVDSLSDSITPFKQFAGQPFEWSGVYDPATRTIVRYPNFWTVTDQAPGRPTSITGAAGEALRVETRAGAAPADADAAAALITADRPDATILSTQPVTRGELSGYAVAYSYRTADGEPFSGYAVVLTSGADARIANLRFPGADVDLNGLTAEAVIAQRTAALIGVVQAAATPEAEATAAPEAAPVDALQLAEYGDYVLILASFSPLPELNLSADSLPPAPPTPLPIVPTAEATAEATVEATAESTVEATAEATVEVTAEVTAAPTAEPTAEPTATDEPTATPEPTNTPEPTSTPTDAPTVAPTATEAQPTARPTGRVIIPTRQPTDEPTVAPTATEAQPTARPTGRVIIPTRQPTAEATPGT